MKTKLIAMGLAMLVLFGCSTSDRNFTKQTTKLLDACEKIEEAQAKSECIQSVTKVVDNYWRKR